MDHLWPHVGDNKMEKADGNQRDNTMSEFSVKKERGKSALISVMYVRKRQTEVALSLKM